MPTERHGWDPHPPFRASAAPVAWGAAALLLAGCSLEEPKSPRFDTDVFVPLGLERTDGRDLIDDNVYIDGDSTGRAPLRFLLQGDVAPFRVGSLLDLDLPSASLAAGLDSVVVPPPAPIAEHFSLGDLAGLSPPTEIPVLVPPFSFGQVSRSLAPQEAFEWLHLAGGETQITLTNTLPIPLGAEETEGIGLRLRNTRDGSLVVGAGLTGRLLPGASWTTRLSLAGLAVDQYLDLELFGESEGSGGDAVVLHPEDGLAVEVRFQGILADSVRAVLPPQELEVGGRLALSTDASVRIQNAVVQDGALSFRLTNPFPLAASGTLTWPSIERKGLPLRLDFAAAALSATTMSLDLAGAAMTMETPAREITYQLRLRTEGSGGRAVSVGTRLHARLDIDAARIRFESLEGSLVERRVVVPNNAVTIEPPEGLDQFSFEAAELTLEVDNGIALPARADLLLTGTPAGGAPVLVPLVFPIAAGTSEGSTQTTFRLDHTLSDLLDLIHARPRTLSLSGSLYAGTGTETALLRRDDEVHARYTLTAPLRAHIGRIRHASEPFHFKVAADVQEHIRDDLVEASAEGSILNHFPAGLEARLSFAARSDALDSAAVILDPIAADLPVVDPSTGRVLEPVRRAFLLQIDPADLSFFARDDVWGRVILSVVGDSARTVEITARDYIEVSGILRFRIRVGS